MARHLARTACLNRSAHGVLRTLSVPAGVGLAQPLQQCGSSEPPVPCASGCCHGGHGGHDGPFGRPVDRPVDPSMDTPDKAICRRQETISAVPTSLQHAGFCSTQQLAYGARVCLG
ncbi:hypothetical protein CMQ_2293 [Grosmannia clavigera kw1407]|uniref:Uncharacterized protein n=1 Tax=Grosmannia clavigera (strain kw1407 / UAMH 11150) TaxID=655863 RepID=F0XJ89_GROCL|nr:uncharacterized protein CMQ_2293 [Grosmannia clavigera kw1407]EFX02244.1 hypothetical protein CMQ_2293 [Grosmannia clavigera kw1407]